VAWSTRQLADLSGTTLRAVRHYHEVGLLEEPERHSNGYKQYGVQHLVRVLQIKRLVDLGVPLAQVASMGRADKEPDEALRLLDADLETSISRLRQVRAELAVILRHRAPIDVPAAFSTLADNISTQDRAMIMVYSRIFDETWMETLRQLMQNEARTDADDEFDALGPDADTETRQRIAEALAPEMRKHAEGYAALGETAAHSSRGAKLAEETITQVIRDLYNPAQLDVLHRAHLIVTGQTP
jgi:DNA-binding transcriptional MerR regulator